MFGGMNLYLFGILDTHLYSLGHGSCICKGSIVKGKSNAILNQWIHQILQDKTLQGQDQLLLPQLIHQHQHHQWFQ